MMTQLFLIFFFTLLFVIMQWLFFNNDKVNYLKRFWEPTAFFFIYMVIMLLLFWEFYRKYFIQVNYLPLFILVIFIFQLSFIFYRVRKRFYKDIKRIYSVNKHNYSITFDSRYLVSKSFQIALQQLLFILLIAIYSDQGMPNIEIIMLSGALFAVVHMYKPIKFGYVYGLYALLFTVLLGTVSAALILFIDYGFIYSFIIHWLFYVATGVFVLKYHKSKALRRYMFKYILQN